MNVDFKVRDVVIEVVRVVVIEEVKLVYEFSFWFG